MNKEMKSFRLNLSTCNGLEKLAKKYNVSQSKIIDVLVLMASCEIFSEKCKNSNNIDLDSFEWFLKN